MRAVRCGDARAVHARPVCARGDRADRDSGAEHAVRRGAEHERRPAGGLRGRARAADRDADLRRGGRRGVAAIIASSALAFDALRYIGAAYLIYLGIKAWRTRDEPMAVGVFTGRAYRQAIVVQLLNPKVALFFLAFLPQFVDPDRGPAATQVLVLGAILGGLGLLMDCGYALLASVGGEALQRPEPLRPAPSTSRSAPPPH